MEEGVKKKGKRGRAGGKDGRDEGREE